MIKNREIQRLLIYCYEYPPIGGGAGNALYYLVREWTRAGVECCVVTSAFGGLTGEIIENDVRVIRLPVGRVEAGRGRVNEMVSYMWASSASAQALVKRLNPDLSIAFMTIPSGAAPYWLNRRQGLPLVTELRGGDVLGFDPDALKTYHAFARPLVHTVWKRSCAVVANSAGLADLARKTCPSISIQVVPNGIDADFFRPNADLKKSGGLRCVYVGRMVESQKRVSLLIRACSEIPLMQLSLIGTGPSERAYRAMAARLAPGRVQFHGWTSKPDLLKVLQAADVYVSASQWEGMPNAALEAMACGLPLILSRAPGHGELVAEGVNGVLVDSSGPRAWIDVLKDLEKKKVQLGTMGASSRVRAVERHQWSEIARQRLELYRQALEEHGRTREKNRL